MSEQPEHALEWIRREGRFRRHIPLGELRKALRRETGQCTWCGGPTPTHRHRWCSDICQRTGYRHCHPGTARWTVARRDKGVCEECGLDTKRLERALRRHLDHHQVREYLRRRGFIPGQALWEADHRTPVAEGGGLCGPSGLRTLCVPCHQKRTAELKGRLAARRRLEAQRKAGHRRLPGMEIHP